MPALIIFIDSLRYDAPLTSVLKALGLRARRVLPPLAYSANILPLLYGGRTPDELGFFNEYGVSERDQWTLLALLDRPVEVIGRIPEARKVLYRALRLCGVNAANIPLRLLPYFRKHARSTYRRISDDPSILHARGFHLVLANGIPRKPPVRDTDALNAALTAVESVERLYVSLNDLDSISHEHGLDSPEYAAHEGLIGAGVSRMIGRFRELHGPQAPVVVLSDHGMAPVDATVGLDVERRLGPVGRDRYLYFLDSTMVRFWCSDQRLLPEIDALLASLSAIGSVVEADERRRWGIEDRAAGDRIFVLREGLVFEPNFIGRGVPLAMHGYHPKYHSQHAVLFENGNSDMESGPLDGSAVFATLERILERA